MSVVGNRFLWRNEGAQCLQLIFQNAQLLQDPQAALPGCANQFPGFLSLYYRGVGLQFRPQVSKAGKKGAEGFARFLGSELDLVEIIAELGEALGRGPRWRLAQLVRACRPGLEVSVAPCPDGLAPGADPNGFDLEPLDLLGKAGDDFGWASASLRADLFQPAQRL